MFLPSGAVHGKPMKNRFSQLVCLLVVAIFCTACPQSSFAASSTILTGKVMTTVTRAPAVQFNGIVEEVLVHPGQHVKVGEPIMRYRLQPESRRTLQREVTMGAGTESMQAQILDLQRQLAQVQAEQKKASTLAARGLGSAQASGRLTKDVSSIDSRIALMNETIAKSQSNFKARLEELSEYFDEPIREGVSLPEHLMLKSPIDGYVLAVDASMNAGATFQAGFMPIRIGEMNPMLIQVPVYEADLASIKVGDKASVEIPSLGDKKFEATVSEIAWVSNDMNLSTASYFNVELTIPNPHLELRPGFKAVVRFGE